MGERSVNHWNRLHDSVGCFVLKDLWIPFILLS